jgi:hypothetical protein
MEHKPGRIGCHSRMECNFFIMNQTLISLASMAKYTHSLIDFLVNFVMINTIWHITNSCFEREGLMEPY